MTLPRRDEATALTAEAARNPELLAYRLQLLEQLVADQAEKIEALQKQETSKLRWGLGALGSIVLTLGGVIWTYRAVIFRGSQ